MMFNNTLDNATIESDNYIEIYVNCVSCVLVIHIVYDIQYYKLSISYIQLVFILCSSLYAN